MEMFAAFLLGAAAPPPGSHVRLTSNAMPPALHAPELEPLVVKDGDLLLRRYDTVFRFRRVKP